MSPLISRQAQRDGGGIYGVHRFAEFFAGKPSPQQGGVQLSSDIETNPPFSGVKRGFWRQAVA